MEKEKELIGTVNIESVNILIEGCDNDRCREMGNSGEDLDTGGLKESTVQNRVTEHGIMLCMDEIAKDVSEKTGIPLGAVRQVLDAETEILVKIGAAKPENIKKGEGQAKNKTLGLSNPRESRDKSSTNSRDESVCEEEDTDEQEERLLTEIFAELEPYLDLFKEGQTVRINIVKKPGEDQKGDENGKES